jgi:DeoR family transcriptional regulator, fructose operon transcriptional repressor
MLPAERHERIRDALRSSRVISTEDLAELLAVSGETVRRDLVALESQGHLRRVHGGASQLGHGEEQPFGERTTSGQEAKASIGRVAAELLVPGQTVVIDVGTTALEVARAVPVDFRGTVATPSLHVAAELASHPGVTVLVSGGRLRGGDLALSNAQAAGFFADLRADIAFLGSGGVAADLGLTDFHLDEVATRRVILAHCARSFVLADAAKIGRIAPFRVCGLDAVAGLITDEPPSADLRIAVHRAGGIVVTGNPVYEAATSTNAAGVPQRNGSSRR